MEEIHLAPLWGGLAARLGSCPSLLVAHRDTRLGQGGVRHWWKGLGSSSRCSTLGLGLFFLQVFVFFHKGYLEDVCGNWMSREDGKIDILLVMIH